MAYLLVILYFLLFCWLLTKSTFISGTGIAKTWLIALFVIKVFCGGLYGYMYSQPALIHASDTWQIYFESLKESRILVRDPPRFFAELFANPDKLSYTGFSQSTTSYWNNLKDNLLIKTEAIMNLFSGGHYYTNVVIYSFITFLGSIAFFRTMNQLYPGRRVLKIFTAFLIPSFLFWTSGLYKDGLIFLFMSVAIYHLNKWITEKQGGWKSLLTILISLVLVFLLRNYVAFLLIPALAGWVISALLPGKSIIVFSAIYGIMALSVVFSKQISPDLDIPRIISTWQTAFLELPANSAIPAKKMEPSVTGLIKSAPQALKLGFLRPHLWENKGLQYIPFALETLAFIILCGVFLFYRQPLTQPQQQFACFCFFLAGSAWLLLGYTVNIIGALVRYKSIYYPLLVGPMLCSISWDNLQYIIKKHN